MHFSSGGELCRKSFCRSITQLIKDQIFMYINVSNVQVLIITYNFCIIRYLGHLHLTNDIQIIFMRYVGVIFQLTPFFLVFSVLLLFFQKYQRIDDFKLNQNCFGILSINGYLYSHLYQRKTDCKINYPCNSAI